MFARAPLLYLDDLSLARLSHVEENPFEVQESGMQAFLLSSPLVIKHSPTGYIKKTEASVLAGADNVYSLQFLN